MDKSGIANRRALVAAADKLFSEKRYPEAEAGYLHIRQSFPDLRYAFVRYAACLHGPARLNERTAAWREVISKFPDFPRGYIELSYCLVESGGGSRARSELAELAELPGASWAVRYALAKLDFAEGRIDEAARLCAGAADAGCESAEIYSLLGEAQMALGCHKAADLAFSKALTLPGVEKRIFASALRAAYLSGSQDSVAAIVDRITTGAGITVQLLQDIQNVYWKLRPEEAPVMLRRLAGPRLEESPFLHLLPEALYLAGQPEQAFAECARILDMHSEAKNVHYQKARLLTAVNNYREASREWASFLSRWPGHHGALVEKVRVDGVIGESGSLAALAELLCERSRDRAMLDSALLYAFQAERWFSVAALCERLLELEPHRARYHLYLAEARYHLGMKIPSPEDIRSILGCEINASVDFARLHKRLSWLESLRVNSDLRRKKQMEPPPFRMDTMDAVYTWVDGADPLYSERLRRFTGIDLAEEERSAHNSRRYESYGEILFSIRSLYKVFPDIRRIHIVTDEQRFDLSSLEPALVNRISFVDHAEIFPGYVLRPTFMSDVIEAFLHRIPGLSEKFFYLNDDVFVGAPLTARDVVDDDGIPYLDVFATEWPDDLEPIYRRMEKNFGINNARHYRSLLVFREKFGYVPGYRDAHQLRILSKTLCELTLDVFGNDWKQTLFNSRVRHAHNPRTCVLRDLVGLHYRLLSVRPEGMLRSMTVYQDFDWEHVNVLLAARPHLFSLNNISPWNRDRFDYLARHYWDTESGVAMESVPEDDFQRAAAGRQYSALFQPGD